MKVTPYETESIEIKGLEIKSKNSIEDARATTVNETTITKKVI